MARKPMRICGCYDTETSAIGAGSDSTAFPVLFICSDLRDVDLASYDATEPVHLYRTDEGFHAYIADMVAWGLEQGVVPVICAYNLMFDLQPVIYELSKDYAIEANAQSSTNVYTLDLVLDGERVLRFWDTFHLEMRGLAAMGATCGLDKATGDWDYKLVRTPETPLTDEEEYYATRDVQVIPAYLRWLLVTNEWLKPGDLASTVVTKTSLVRQQAAREIGPMKVDGERRGKPAKRKLAQLYMTVCADEFPQTYAQYAIRKACFRGGFTFTAGAYASRVHRDVASFDVTSMHHAFINGRFMPTGFRPADPRVLEGYVRQTASATVRDVLRVYHEPFAYAYHACVRFRNIRLRAGSAFESYQIGLIPEGKFRATGARAEWGAGESDIDAETSIRSSGYADAALDPLFAFGKLYRAREVRLHVCELEVWCIAQVYEWDGMEVEYGEATTSYTRPPDYVTLQSNLLFERKQAMKEVLHRYREGAPYAGEIPSSIPVGIAADLRAGTASVQDLTGYYNSTVKGMFNGIYGVQAQDLMKPTYECVDGELRVDRSTVATRGNYAERMPERPKAVYTYGMRIVGGSRMHMVIAIMLVHARFGERARVLGGDTDSMKVALDGIAADDVLEALAPLHDAVTRAIAVTQSRVRGEFPDVASGLDGIGTFDYEGTAPMHMEAWNKARIWWDGERTHVTCAGLPRPKGCYTLETWMDERVREPGDFEALAPAVLGYNCYISNGVSHVLERTRPHPWECVDMDVTDYRGVTSHVSSYKSIALYDAGRYLGDMTKRGNVENVRYLAYRGVDVDVREREVSEEGLSYG